ncbi:glycoside hydrolase family 26 protein [Sphingomonas lenta]|uniref:glycoside hydrolase family 26 protein n=1 Tax=Sphingomonas lenta TaxID=1141887 RepID=UPI00159515C1|nr:glycosyl hydrolase [Sphingomonas lenta]
MAGLAGALALFGAAPAAASDATPANPSAIPKAREVQAMLASLTRRSADRLISGQFAGYPNVNDLGTNNFDMEYLHEIHRRSGVYPKLTGADFTGRTAANDSNTRTFRYEAVLPALKAWWAKGGYVTTFSHFPRPDTYDPATRAGPNMRTPDGGYDMARILPGGPDRAKWVAIMDQEIAALTDLQRSGVVSLHRLFPEMNGNWFWWCDQKPEVFKQVWRDAFDYYKSKGVNNALWVFNTTRLANQYYPGDDYVDFVSVNLYDFYWPTQEQYEGFLSLGKPFGIFEFGPGTTDPAAQLAAPVLGGAKRVAPPNNYDWRDLATRIKRDYPETSLFMVWHDGFKIGNGRYVREFMNDPWMLNLGDPVEPRRK